MWCITFPFMLANIGDCISTHIHVKKIRGEGGGNVTGPPYDDRGTSPPNDKS